MGAVKKDGKDGTTDRSYLFVTQVNGDLKVIYPGE